MPTSAGNRSSKRKSEASSAAIRDGFYACKSSRTVRKDGKGSYKPTNSSIKIERADSNNGSNNYSNSNDSDDNADSSATISGSNPSESESERSDDEVDEEQHVSKDGMADMMAKILAQEVDKDKVCASECYW